MKFKALLVLALIFVSATVSAKEIKVTFVAPEGSTWAKVVNEWDKELRSKTGGKLGFKIYAGGVLGDERDIVRKMRIGQVHAAGLTGLGLGIINPSVRVLELPMMAHNYKEVDALVAGLGPQLEKGFKPKGFQLLGWSETGFVNVFSNKPVKKCDDLKGMKMWAWEGDPVVKAMYERFNVVPIPLALPDVLTSLSTHLIDGVYAPPLGAIALQWNTKTKYMSDVKLANSTGGFVITTKALNSLSPAHKKLLMESGRRYSKLLKERIRADNERSYEALNSMGTETVKISPDEVKKIQDVSKLVWKDLAGKLYSPALLEKAKKILAGARGGK